MLCEGFANPIILTVFSTDEDDKTIPGGIVRVEKVADNVQKTEAAGEDDEDIFRTEKIVQVLLKLLGFWSEPSWAAKGSKAYQRQRKPDGWITVRCWHSFT